jgi:hypothetical protein
VEKCITGAGYQFGHGGCPCRWIGESFPETVIFGNKGRAESQKNQKGFFHDLKLSKTARWGKGKCRTLVPDARLPIGNIPDNRGNSLESRMKASESPAEE